MSLPIDYVLEEGSGDKKHFLGITVVPGKFDGASQRDILGDLQYLKDVGVTRLVNMLTEDEMKRFKIDDLTQVADAVGINVSNLPLPDNYCWDAVNDAQRELTKLVDFYKRKRENLVIFCNNSNEDDTPDIKGGRSGLVVACMAIQMGLFPANEQGASKAMGLVAVERSSSHLSETQKEFITKYAVRAHWKKVLPFTESMEMVANISMSELSSLLNSDNFKDHIKGLRSGVHLITVGSPDGGRRSKLACTPLMAVIIRLMYSENTTVRALAVEMVRHLVTEDDNRQAFAEATGFRPLVGNLAGESEDAKIHGATAVAYVVTKSLPNCKAFVAEKGLQTLIPLIRDKNPKIQISALNAMLRFLEAIGEAAAAAEAAAQTAQAVQGSEGGEGGEKHALQNRGTFYALPGGGISGGSSGEPMTDVHRFKAQLVDDMVVAGLADGIAHVLRTVTGNNNLLVTVCQILSVFAYRSLPAQTALARASAVSALIQQLKPASSDPNLLLAVVSSLVIVSTNSPPVQDAISECRGLNEIIPVLQRAGNSDAIIEKLVALIRNACVNHPANQVAFFQHGSAVVSVLDVIGNSINPKTQETGASCLWALTTKNDTGAKYTPPDEIYMRIIGLLATQNKRVLMNMLAVISNLNLNQPKNQKTFVKLDGGVGTLVKLVSGASSREIAEYAIEALIAVIKNNADTVASAINSGALIPLVNIVGSLSPTYKSIQHRILAAILALIEKDETGKTHSFICQVKGLRGLSTCLLAEKNETVQQLALQCILIVASDKPAPKKNDLEANRRGVQAAGVGPGLLVCLASGNPMVVALAASTISIVAYKNPVMQDNLQFAGVYQSLVKLLHRKNPAVLEAAADAIWGLTLDNEKAKKAMKELSVVDSLMGLVSSEYNEVKSSVFRALAALADGDGKNKKEIMKYPNSATFIVSGLRSDNRSVQSQASSLVAALCKKSSDNQNAIGGAGGGDSLANVLEVALGSDSTVFLANVVAAAAALTASSANRQPFKSMNAAEKLRNLPSGSNNDQLNKNVQVLLNNIK